MDYHHSSHSSHVQWIFNGLSTSWNIKIAKDIQRPTFSAVSKKIDGRRKIAAKPIFMSSMVQCPIIAAATGTASQKREKMALTGA